MDKKLQKPKNPLLSRNASGQTLSETVSSIVRKGGDETRVESGNSPPSHITQENGWPRFNELIVEFTGVKGQGSAVWIPTQLKKEIEMICARAKSNIPIRALAAAMIAFFIERHRAELENL